jgi:hypothetical protein
MSTWKDNTTLAVLNPTDIKTSVLSIDSKFRDVAQSTSSSDFLIRLPRTYKNVITMRLSSIELPNTWYTYEKAHGDTGFLLNGVYGSIPSGNYDPNALAVVVQDAFNAVGTRTYTVAFNSITGLITINSNDSAPFTMQFAGVNSFVPYDSGLGYSMGFTQASYVGRARYTGEYVVDTLSDNYVLMQLPDVESAVDSFTYGSSSIEAFAKIIVTVPKYGLVYDDGSNLITKQIQFAQPTNISFFRVRLVDAYGNVLVLHADFSFTLEFQEVVNSKTYSAYRTNLLS